MGGGEALHGEVRADGKSAVSSVIVGLPTIHWPVRARTHSEIFYILLIDFMLCIGYMALF